MLQCFSERAINCLQIMALFYLKRADSREKIFRTFTSYFVQKETRAYSLTGLNLHTGHQYVTFPVPFTVQLINKQLPAHSTIALRYNSLEMRSTLPFKESSYQEVETVTEKRRQAVWKVTKRSSASMTSTQKFLLCSDFYSHF